MMGLHYGSFSDRKLCLSTWSGISLSYRRFQHLLLHALTRKLQQFSFPHMIVNFTRSFHKRSHRMGSYWLVICSTANSPFLSPPCTASERAFRACTARLSSYCWIFSLNLSQVCWSFCMRSFSLSTSTWKLCAFRLRNIFNYVKSCLAFFQFLIRFLSAHHLRHTLPKLLSLQPVSSVCAFSLWVLLDWDILLFCRWLRFPWIARLHELVMGCAN